MFQKPAVRPALRRPLQLALATMLFSMLGACASSTTFDAAPVAQLQNAQPDARLLEPCLGPVRLPRNRDMSREEASRAWGRDRARLVDCGERHDATVQFYQERDAALAGTTIK